MTKGQKDAGSWVRVWIPKGTSIDVADTDYGVGRGWNASGDDLDGDGYSYRETEQIQKGTC